MASKEAIDYIEKAKTHLERFGGSSSHCYDYLNQALAILKEQPSAGEFTKKCREKYGYKFMKVCRWNIHCGKAFKEACDIIDTSEASRKDLLEACLTSHKPIWFSEYATFAEVCSLKPTMAVYKQRFVGLAKFLRSCVGEAEKIEAAIAKAQKEGGE